METNTPPRGPQRGPGQNQIAEAVEPILDKAARELGIDQLAIRRINAAGNDARIGARQGPVTSAYQDETLVQGAELFNWEEKRTRSRQRNGSRVIGVGIGQCYHSAGRNSYDGLVRITPDGVLHIHTGCGNLGTYSQSATARVAAEVLKQDWANCVIERGDSRRHLPWAPTQTGSNTSFTCTRTNYVAAMDALAKLREIAAMDLGGSPDDYDIGDETVFAAADPSRRITYAEAAQRAIDLGGRFSGEEAPEDIHDVTRMAVAGLAGSGLVGVAKDNLRHEGVVPAIASGFIEIELDLETGKFDILDYVGVADCGTVLHPQGPLSNQVKGGAGNGPGNGVHGTPRLRPAERSSSQRGLPPGQAGVISGRSVHHAMGCRGRRRPAEPRGRQGRRRTDPGLRFGSGALRHLGCAGRTLLQPRARQPGHDRQRRRGTAAVACAAGGEYGLDCSINRGTRSCSGPGLSLERSRATMHACARSMSD